MTSEVNFCQRCGHRLSEKRIEDKVRPYCEHCGYVVFLDPKIAAVVLVSMDGKLVLVRRDIDPARGHWSFPAGYVDRGEVVEEGAQREVKEETGLNVELDGFVGIYSKDDSPVVLVVYAANVTGGCLRPGPEVQEIGLFSPDQMPPMPFPHDHRILEDWKAMPSSNWTVSP